MNPVGITLTAIASLLLLFGSRTTALLSVIGSVLYITQGQNLNIGGFSFYANRIVLLVGLIRIVTRGELRRIQFNRIDWLMVAFVVQSCVVGSLRTGRYQESVGAAYNILLSYFVFRCLVGDWEELGALVPKLAVLLIPAALFMMYESKTTQNLFAIMGGQPEQWFRNGRVRCLGAFRGPHTSGISGACFIPLFAWLFGRPGKRSFALAGMAASLLITYTANSSGPIMCLASGMAAMACWRFRTKMRMVRWGIVAALIAVAIFQKAPIWYILAKISDVIGGDGWYRSYLMEQCFKHFFDWWLVGTDNTVSWAATWMPWGGADLCNIYVSCAAGSGLLGLCLIIALFSACFKALGQALAVARDHGSPGEGLMWSMGCVLFGHVCTLFSVTYFDQFQVVWWGSLGIISSITAGILTAEESGAKNINVDSIDHVEEFQAAAQT